MKKLIVLIMFVLSFDIVLGYTPSPKFESQVKQSQEFLSKQLNQIHHDKINNIKNKFQNAQKDYTRQPKIQYAISKRIETIQNHINQTQNVSFETQTANSFRKAHGQKITSGLNISNRCMKYYDQIDQIAKQNNFPTELIIATWYREYSCILGYPDNGYGPFQITSSYYQPGDININQFQKSIQDFIDFSKGKRKYFENNPALRKRFGQESISINHNKYSLRDIRLHSILYNGVISGTTLENNMYANGNLSEKYPSSRDGIVTFLLKVINQKINS